MLPKVAYFYWGSETMSFLRYMTFASFRKYHPDWDIVLVTRLNPLECKDYGWAETQDFMYEPLIDYSDRLDDLGIEIVFLEEEFPEIAALDISDVHTSDILAWYVLAKKGGIVSDTDIVYTAPFNYEKFKDTEFGIVCFQGFPKPNYMPVSFMISQPNDIMNEVYKNSLKMVDKNKYESAGTIVLEYTVGSFDRMVHSYSTTKVDRLPSKIVFPFAEDYPWSTYSHFGFEKNEFNNLSADTIGIHWYAGAPGNQKYNRAYRHDTYSNYYSTIGSAIGAVLND